jgi:hypothetical protein
MQLVIYRIIQRLSSIIEGILLQSFWPPGDLTVSKRTGTSNRVEIQFRTFNPLSRPDSFVKLFETLCLCLAQGNGCLGQI